MSRYEYVFNDELERYVDQLINEEPVGKDRKQKLQSRSRTIRSGLKRLNCVEKSVLDAFKLYEGRDLFFVDLQTFFQQVRQRILSLKNVLRTKYAGS